MLIYQQFDTEFCTGNYQCVGSSVVRETWKLKTNYGLEALGASDTSEESSVCEQGGLCL